MSCFKNNKREEFVQTNNRYLLKYKIDVIFKIFINCQFLKSIDYSCVRKQMADCLAYLSDI